MIEEYEFLDGLMSEEEGGEKDEALEIKTKCEELRERLEECLPLVSKAIDGLREIIDGECFTSLVKQVRDQESCEAEKKTQ